MIPVDPMKEFLSLASMGVMGINLNGPCNLGERERDEDLLSGGERRIRSPILTGTGRGKHMNLVDGGQQSSTGESRGGNLVE